MIKRLLTRYRAWRESKKKPVKKPLSWWYENHGDHLFGMDLTNTGVRLADVTNYYREQVNKEDVNFRPELSAEWQWDWAEKKMVHRGDVSVKVDFWDSGYRHPKLSGNVILTVRNGVATIPEWIPEEEVPAIEERFKSRNG